MNHELLPVAVRTALSTVTRSVLIDADRLTEIRERYASEQTESLGRYLAASQSPNTLRAYRSDWCAWLGWCQQEGRQALPADPLDVAVYLAAAADAVRDDGRPAFSPATLDRKAAAIAAVHAANGLPSPTRSDVVRLTMRGVRRTRRAQPQRKRPVLLHTLSELLEQVPAGIAGVRDRMLLLIGFAGALRRSELAGLSVDDVEVHTDPGTGEPVLILRLGVTKTDQVAVYGQQVALPRGAKPQTCPVCAVADWLRVLETGSLPQRDPGLHGCHGFTGTPLADGHGRPLVPAVDRYGRIGTKAMSDRSVANIVKKYAQQAGLDPALFAGHSLRAGFATQAALGGAGDREIMRQGRWSNAAMVHRYIRTAKPLEDNAVTKLGL
ncbi:integrase [Pseudonocardiaceae bacterium YIM PH 21723]|nr:integrase [Pseudonocardiaceae bacterium YIM PH 21723]